MSLYIVTTVISAYDEYEVEADSPEAAKWLVLTQSGELPSHEAGYGDDLDIVSIRGKGEDDGI